MNTATDTQFRHADAAAIADAATVLRRGGLVAFPTETVYGLGADATNGNAVASVFAAKGRPQFNPLIVHVKDMAQAETLVHFSAAATELAKLFWPGALTLVLPRRRGSPVSLLASAGLETIALRMPAHPVAEQLLRDVGVPIAAPSANPSGRISATAAAHVAEELRGKIDLILDGGPTPLGIEFTVIGFDRDLPVLLRSGAITRDAIEAAVGPLLKPGSGKIASPGQLQSHYAPRARIRLDADGIETGEALLAFGPKVPDGARQTLNLSPGGDLREAAANLFAMLRTLDNSGAATIAVMPVPHAGLGEAINDRLQRAAAPRGDQR